MNLEKSKNCNEFKKNYKNLNSFYFFYCNKSHDFKCND